MVYWNNLDMKYAVHSVHLACVVCRDCWLPSRHGHMSTKKHANVKIRTNSWIDDSATSHVYPRLSTHLVKFWKMQTNWLCPVMAPHLAQPLNDIIIILSESQQHETTNLPQTSQTHVQLPLMTIDDYSIFKRAGWKTTFLLGPFHPSTQPPWWPIAHCPGREAGMPNVIFQVTSFNWQYRLGPKSIRDFRNPLENDKI